MLCMLKVIYCVENICIVSTNSCEYSFMRHEGKLLVVEENQPNQSREGGNYYGPATTHIYHTTQIHIGTYKILSEIHQRIHGDNRLNGEAAEEGCQIRVEQRLSRKSG